MASLTSACDSFFFPWVPLVSRAIVSPLVPGSWTGRKIFANLFEFESPDKASTYKEKGTKFGANASLGNFIIEGGYLDDDQNNDAFFGSIKFVVKLGKFDSNSYKLEQSKKTRNYLEYTDVSDKLYQPVKRENKIRVVKISKSDVKVGGF